MIKKRILWIDVAKGLLIILVVFGHCHINTYVDVAINSFHMAGFFILSGLTFSTKRNFLGGGGKDAFLLTKIKTIVLPYLLFSFLMILQRCLSAKFITHNDINLIDGIVSIFIPISGRKLYRFTDYGFCLAFFYRK